MSNRYEGLQQVPLFADLSRKDLAHVDRLATRLDRPAGNVLLREGELAHEMYVIVDGTAEVVRDDEVLGELGPGDFVGEMALLAHARRTSTVRATSDLTVLHLEGRSFHQLLEDVPSIAVQLAITMAERIASNADLHSA